MLKPICSVSLYRHVLSNLRVSQDALQMTRSTGLHRLQNSSDQYTAGKQRISVQVDECLWHAGQALF